jgi:plastocyanin
MGKLRFLLRMGLVSTIVVCGCVGCGSKEETPAAPAPAASSTPGATLAASAAAATLGKASISGKVTFTGAAPTPKKIATSADPKCEEMHADKPLTSEAVIVNSNGTLRNVFVYVKGGLEDKTYPTPTDPVEIDQKGCQYRPHVFGMQAGQALKIKNADPTLHNIHAQCANNAEFNIGQPNLGMETTRTFAKPEIMVHFKCDVHPWMSAYVGVLTHPFYSVTGDDGTFALKNLPAGRYVVAAWHETYGEQTQTIAVADGESKEITFAVSSEGK